MNGLCYECDKSCKTCQDTPSFCLSCRPNKFFYGTFCESVSNSDDYRYEPNDDNICIIPGLVCTFGYKVTPGGNGCVLKN